MPRHGRRPKAVLRGPWVRPPGGMEAAGRFVWVIRLPLSRLAEFTDYGPPAAQTMSGTRARYAPTRPAISTTILR